MLNSRVGRLARRIRASVSLFPVALIAGCGGSSNSCPPPQQLAIVGYTSTTPVDGLCKAPSPYPSNAQYLCFSVSDVQNQNTTNPTTEVGTGVLSGSDGSTITLGPLQSIILASDLTGALVGYIAAVSGLKPNVTYSVSFPSLKNFDSDCSYGTQSSGSFQTTAPT